MWPNNFRPGRPTVAAGPGHDFVRGRHEGLREEPSMAAGPGHFGRSEGRWPPGKPGGCRHSALDALLHGPVDHCLRIRRQRKP